MLFPLLLCLPLEYCFCSALSRLTFGRVRLSVLQFGEDSFCLSFYRIWQLTGKEHEDILWLSIMLSCLLTLWCVCFAQGLSFDTQTTVVWMLRMHRKHERQVQCIKDTQVTAHFHPAGVCFDFFFLAIFHSVLFVLPSEGFESRHVDITESIKDTPPKTWPRGPSCHFQGSLILDFLPHYSPVKLPFASPFTSDSHLSLINYRGKSIFATTTLTLLQGYNLCIKSGLGITLLFNRYWWDNNEILRPSSLSYWHSNIPWQAVT